MRSFVDILILGHPLPYLLRGTFLEIDHFWNFAVVIYKFLKTSTKLDIIQFQDKSFLVLLISSGMVSSNDLNPASICMILILSLKFLYFLL